MSSNKKLLYIFIDIVICAYACFYFEKIIGTIFSISFFSITGIIVMIVIAKDRPI